MWREYIKNEKQYICFLTDLHADREAFLRSVEKCSHLENPLYIFGGDFLDKGPSNLSLLREIDSFRKQNDVIFLAGNHDLRMLMALQAWDCQNDEAYKQVFTEKRKRTRITPFIDECGGADKAQRMFLHPDGEFYWFFENLNFVYVDTPFLFIHAGVSDQFVEEFVNRKGELNPLFQGAIKSPSKINELYYGSLGAGFRTKYRKSDPILTTAAVKELNKFGIKYVIHGHDSQLNGHTIKNRRGLPHIVGDCTIDFNSRKKELGEEAMPGFGVLVIDKLEQIAQGISSEGGKRFFL